MVPGLHLLRFPTWLWRNSGNSDHCPNLDPASGPTINVPASASDAIAGRDSEQRRFKWRTHCKKWWRDGSHGCENRRKTQMGMEMQSLDMELDVVVVQSDCGESVTSIDWSVGWFEPHSAAFCRSSGSSDADCDPEKSFAVLVPCYSYGVAAMAPAHCFPPQSFASSPVDSANCSTKSQLWASVLSNIANDPRAEGNHYLQQWLSSLQS